MLSHCELLLFFLIGVMYDANTTFLGDLGFFFLFAAKLKAVSTIEDNK